MRWGMSSLISDPTQAAWSGAEFGHPLDQRGEHMLVGGHLASIARADRMAPTQRAD